MKNLEQLITDINSLSFDNIVTTLPNEVDEKEVIEEFQLLKDNMLNSVVPQQDKLLIHMAGLPGSGKSTYCENVLLKKLVREEILYLGFDDVMEKISFYQEEKKKDIVNAFKRWEIPARILGYEILVKAFEKNLSVLFDNGASNARHLEIIELFQENNYRIKMYYLGGTPQQLIPRVAQREAEGKRHLPLEEMESRYNSLQKVLEKYKIVVDDFYDVTNI
ncbi:zeta toxin family protein [Flammeovirgaceae bacterium SG7u.111]|nr:zeta toxin family protein [Flammeovirgaceae bacterium SG7u.132]WPO37128.1 zeta toxin family protein [Flammeovirgaceae bacterium SG7u.111]